MKSRTLIHTNVLLLFFLVACQKEQPKVDFLTLTDSEQRQAQNALASMETAPGVEVELFAAEPLLTNPTNISVDEKGRVWLCEANNYRLPFNPRFEEREQGDRILILEDTDGDGKADERKVYYQGPEVNAALGISVFGNQVFVSCSPNVLVFTDEDADDKPDKIDTLFTGIQGVDDDHGMHAFSFGPDGRLYFNCGNNSRELHHKNGAIIKDPQGYPIAEAQVEDQYTQNQKKRPLPYRQGMVFRANMDGSEVEVLGHNFRNIFEVAIDPFGNLWQTDNDDDGNKGARVNFVMEYGNFGYKDEITGAGWRERRLGMHDEIPKRHWHLNDPGVVPNLLQTGAGSPAGLCFYEGYLLPEVFHNQMIHCEALKNVVRAYPVEKDGAGFTAKMVNLLKSKDQWFRPSDVAVAPDGSVFVADWYDAGVGGNKMDDIQRGRIYRLAPDTRRYKVPKVDLSAVEGAIAAFNSPNMATFYLGWNKLFELKNEALPALKAQYDEGTPEQKAKALWLLAKIEGEGALKTALENEDPDLRITALRAYRYLFPEKLVIAAKSLAADPSLAVRREVTIALRDIGSEEAADIWANLALQYDGQDRWYLEALGIGAYWHDELYFDAWKEKAGQNWMTKSGKDIVWRMRSEATLPLLVEMIKDPNVNEAELPRYFRSFHFKSVEKRDPYIASLLEVDHPLKEKIAAYALGQLSDQYVMQKPSVRTKIKSILPSIEGAPEWLSAVKSLKLKGQTPQLLDFFLKNEDSSLSNEAAQLFFDLGGKAQMKAHLTQLDEKDQQSLINRLGYVQNREVVALLEELLAEPNQPQSIRRTLVESLGSGWDGQHRLYDLIREGKIQGDLKTTAAIKLMNCWNPEIRFAASDFLVSAKNKAGNYLPSIPELADKKGNARLGRSVFVTYCQTCHQIAGQGTDFGPDLSAIGDKLAKKAIYSSIIYPSAGINFGYEGYQVKRNDGAVFTGYIASKTDEKLILKVQGGITHEFATADIESLKAMDQSLMTPNLHEVMEEKELVDLVEYLVSQKEK